MRRRSLRLLALAPVVGLALAACSSTSTGGGSGSGGDQGSGPGITSAGAGGGLLAKPVSVSAISGATIGGGTTSTAAYAGKVVVLNFYASWCAPCAAETPLLEQTSKEFPGVQFLGVLSNDSATNGESFRDKYGVTYPSLIDSSGADVAKFRSLSPSGLPVTFVLDKQGKVAARYVGGIDTGSGLPAVLTKLQAE